MTHDEFNAFCGKLPAAHHVVQWGGSHVWKVGDKVFAIGAGGNGAPAYSFKVSPLAFEMLRERPGLRPAPYLASRGLSWIQHFGSPGLSDDELRDYLRESHCLVASGLTGKKRLELKLDALGFTARKRR
ncbi:MmcQ/YjbR family DNA-binding protein [Methylocystis parvus]|uniref:MmcQ/YjbR family DNA-binding protein n=1 Tax=Methylocystis parvus TaxID=134 RepID=A0A6B8M742_9HYPH|nr:MmcQ/YjbR family DNA-binding protein [Methylocystis parvus]QGM98661.1 MmcQ/YjbR family DNA-binding protein [Methylocystis parvus]WBK00991.1 MmcQ/YjbR family DNA-binding protein [Methylocystis parvus OBBP]